MNGATQSGRWEALYRWRGEQAARGYQFAQLPTDTDLFTVASSSAVTPEELGALSLNWAVTTNDHLRQMSAVLSALGGDSSLSADPSSAPTAEQPVVAGEVVDAGPPAAEAPEPVRLSAKERRERLLEWAAAKRAAGIPANELPQDRDLQRVASTAAVEAHEIADLRTAGRQLIGRWATELAAVLQGRSPGDGSASSGTASPDVDETPEVQASPPPAPSAPPRPERPQDPAREETRPAGESFWGAADAQPAPPTGPASWDDEPAQPRSDPWDAPATGAWAPAATGPADESAQPGWGAEDPWGPPSSAASFGSGASTRAPSRFARFDPVQEPARRLRPAKVSIALTAQGLTYGWPTPPEAVVRLVRVVVSDDYEPLSPERGRVISPEPDAVTVVDPVEPSRALRYVEVWVNEGGSEEAAHASQPYLLASGRFAAPVQNCVIVAAAGRVTGRWRTTDGVDSVEVYRVPAERAASTGLDPADLLRSVAPDGFEDAAADPGRRYEYRVLAKVVLQDVELYSPMVVQQVVVEADPEPVIDLTLEVSEQGVDLTWTTPRAGEALIFALANAPVRSLSEAPLRPDQLTPQGFTREAVLNHAHRVIQLPDGRSRLTLSPPRDADAIHFTPVTRLGDLAHVGRSVPYIGLGSARDLRVVERVGWQLLTFGWPSLAHKVHVHLTPTNGVFHGNEVKPFTSQSQDEWRWNGGIRFFRTLGLPEDGCDIHVVPVRSYGGQSHFGLEQRVHYRGLVRARYQLTPVSRLRSRSRHVEIQCTKDFMPPGGFVLVYNPRRLPLSPQDGELLIRPIESPLGRNWQRLTDQPFELPRHGGYVRLFANFSMAPDRPDFALLDPPVDTLRAQ